jgi:hypothetical protein
MRDEHIAQAEHGEAVRLTKGGRLDAVLAFSRSEKLKIDFQGAQRLGN